MQTEELLVKKNVEKADNAITDVTSEMVTDTEIDKLPPPVKPDEYLSQVRRTLSEESAKQNTRELLLEVMSMTDDDDHDRRRHTPKMSQTATPTNTPLSNKFKLSLIYIIMFTLYPSLTFCCC